MTEDPNTPDRSSDSTGSEPATEQWWARPSGALSRPAGDPVGDTAPQHGDPVGGRSAGQGTGAGEAPGRPDPAGQTGQGGNPGGYLQPADGAAGHPDVIPGGSGYPAADGRPGTQAYPVQHYGQPGRPGQYGQGPATGFGYQQQYGTGGYQTSSFSGGGFGGPGRPTAVLTPQPAPGHGPGNGRGKRSTAVVATAVILGIGAAFGAGYLGSQVGSPSTANAADSSLTQTSQSSPAAAKVEPGSVQSAADAVLPSVVSVIAITGQSGQEGSGVVLSADGTILTNAHVVSGAQQISVRFNDGTTAKADLVGSDPTDDLAVIRAKGASGLKAATLGSSGTLQVGQTVVAIGSPLGLSATVTSGIVSAQNRPVRTQSAQDPQQQQQQQGPFGGQDPNQQDPNQQDPTQQAASADTVLNAIQTDAAINHGNSGGPLIDLGGKVIGINTAIASSSSSSDEEGGSIGIGFAIPIDQAKRIADEIIKNGFATHAVLGATVQSASAADQLTTSGAQIASVTDGSAAAKAGLKKGDVVTKVGSQTIESSDALVAAIRSQIPGGTVDLTYLRGSQSSTVKVTLGSAKSN